MSVARWGFFVVALVLGLALLVSSISSYAGATALVETVMRGQAQSLSREIGRAWAERADTPPRHGPPDDAALEDILAEQRGNDLRYIAVIGPREEVMSEAGTTTTTRFVAPGEQRVVDDLVQATFFLRARRPPHEPNRPRARPGLGPGRAPPPPRVAIEFVPRTALALRARALRDLVVGVTVAVALLLGAAVFWRLSLRAEAVQRRWAEQRHLASLGEMSAVLAHELRNPLASLKGHVQLLAERVAEQPPLARKTARILEETLRLETLTGGLLDFARTGVAKREAVDPAALVRDRARRCTAEHEVRVDATGAPSSWPLDAAKIEQVADNLLDNARQAAPDQPIEVTIGQQGGALVLRVRDHGPGVDPSEAERIFEPFVTTRTRGTGLGLAICRRIVALHGGTLRVESAPGGGACFVATLRASG